MKTLDPWDVLAWVFVIAISGMLPILMVVLLDLAWSFITR